MTDKIVALTTCETSDVASKIARHLVETSLAACVNIIPGARSIYRWKGAIEEASEFVLLIKSRRDLFPQLRSELEKIHPYEVPELVALQIVDGSEPYLAWLDQQISK